MGRIAESVIADVQQATDLVELVSATVALKRAGSAFKGLCPFHPEKTPSFHVNPARQIFHCFGCGAGGTAFTWVMRQDGITFPEAVRRLAERAGIRIVEEGSDRAERSATERDALWAANQWAMERFRSFLKAEAGDAAKAYLKRRGVTGKAAAQFSLGYAPGGGQLLEPARRDGVDLEKAGLAGRREDGSVYEMFRSRVIFPILDANDRVVGFGGRSLGDAEPKYLNTAQNVVFHKGRVLYGFSWARRAIAQRKEVLVVEGYMDCLMAHQHGVDWTVATLGTALTEDHVRMLSRQADRILLVFDPDEAGLRAALRGLSVFARFPVEVRVVVMPGKEDPSDFLAARGREAFLECLKGAQGVVSFRVEMSRRAGEWDSPEGKSKTVRELVEWATASPDAIRRELILQEISRASGIPLEVLRTGTGREGGRSQAAAPLRRRAARPGTSDQVQRDLLRFLAEESCRERVLAEVDAPDFAGGRFERLAERAFPAARSGSPFGPAAIGELSAEVEEAERLSEVLAVDLPEGEGGREARERWLAECLQWVRRMRLDRSVPGARERLREGGGDPHAPWLNDTLRRMQEELQAAGRKP